MTAREYALWQDYDAVEPIGGERLDLAAGIVAATIANVHRGKNVEAFKPADFMPLMPKRESADGGLAQFIAWAKGHNARLKEASDG